MLWIDPQLESNFAAWIVAPYANPQLYHDELTPLPWAHCIVGREGVHKLESILKLCQQFSVPVSAVVSVQFGKCKAAMDEVMRHMVRLSSETTAYANGNIAVRGLVIVQHADILCYDSMSPETAALATELAVMARQEHVMLIALCDRPSNAEELEKMTPWALKCHSKFFAQFATTLLAPCPTVDFLIALTRQHLEVFCAHLKTNANRTVGVVLTEDDWLELRDYVAYATQQQLLEEWLTPVFFDILNNPSASVIDMELLCKHIYQKRGVRHICSGYDAMAVENRFRDSCGYPRIGTAVAAPKRAEAAESNAGDCEEIALMKTLSSPSSPSSPKGSTSHNQEEDEFGIKPEHEPEPEQEPEPEPKPATRKRARPTKKSK